MSGSNGGRSRASQLSSSGSSPDRNSYRDEQQVHFLWDSGHELDKSRGFAVERDLLKYTSSASSATIVRLWGYRDSSQFPGKARTQLLAGQVAAVVAAPKANPAAPPAPPPENAA